MDSGIRFALRDGGCRMWLWISGLGMRHRSGEIGVGYEIAVSMFGFGFLGWHSRFPFHDFRFRFSDGDACIRPGGCRSLQVGFQIHGSVVVFTFEMTE